MGRIGFILLMMMTLHACEEVADVDFFIKAEGFKLDNAFSDQEPVPPPFKHRILGGLVSFSGNGASYRFDLRDANLESFQFSLPAGQYLLEFSMLPASLYGQQFASFSYEPAEVFVGESIDTITIAVKANCALFLVDDSMHQLDNGVHMIKRHSYSEGYFTSYPLEKDEFSGLYYAYFNPDPVSSDPSAFLWFYNGRPDTAEGGLSTCDFEPGYQYYIKILD